MRRFLRRLAWLILRLWLVAAVTFFVVAKVTDGTAGKPVFSTDRLEESRLPLFFNLHPVDLATEVDSIVRQLSSSPRSVDAQQLVRLGAAAFPLLMPRLVNLPTEARARASWMLLPVAQRMTWHGSTEIHSESASLEYMMVTWSERSVDFQPTMVARWVERLAARGEASLAASVVEYDTFALPWLLAALRDVETPGDLPRAQRLLSVASHITSIPWTIVNGSSPAEAQAVVDRWRRWWDLHGVEYTEVRGLSRWSTMLKQTRFGQWSNLVFLHRFGTTRDNQPIVAQLAARAPRSTLLLLSGMVGALVATLTRLLRTRYPRTLVWPKAAGVVVASIPHVSVVGVLACSGLPRSMLVACIAACIATFLFALDTSPPLARHTHRRLASITEVPPGQMHRMSRIPNWLIAGYVWPFQLTLIFVVELAFGVHGLGEATVTAFRQRDLHMLMAISTLTAAVLLALEFLVQLKRSTPREERISAPNP